MTVFEKYVVLFQLKKTSPIVFLYLCGFVVSLSFSFFLLKVCLVSFALMVFVGFCQNVFVEFFSKYDCVVFGQLVLFVVWPNSVG